MHFEEVWHMKFCEFLKLMGKYFGKEHKSQAALLSSICGWFINDKQEVFKNETDPILNEITDSSNRPKVSNIFTGKSHLMNIGLVFFSKTSIKQILYPLYLMIA